MNQRKFILVAIAAVAIVLGFWIVGSYSDSSVSPSGVIPPSTREEDPAPSRVSIAPGVSPVTTSPFVETNESTPEPSGTPRARISIEGRIKVVDEKGIESLPIDGRLGVYLRRGEHASGVETDVRAGAFLIEMDSPLPESLTPRFITSGESTLWISDEAVTLAADRPVLLTARLTHDLRVKVVSEVTKLALAGISVSTAGDHESSVGLPEHPGPKRKIILEGAASPVRIPAPEDRESYELKSHVLWFGAKGYAWMPLELDHRTRGERYVALPPGGALEVEIAGPIPKGSARFCLRPAGEHMPLIDISVPRSQPFLLDGLRAVAFEAAVEEGRWYENPTKLGVTQVTVRAGETARATVQIRERPANPESVPVAGTLTLPATWKIDMVTMEFRARGMSFRVATIRRLRIKTPPPEHGEAGNYSWDIGGLPPGAWEAVISPIGIHAAIDVPAGGDRQIAIVVPEPAVVRVRLQDRADGKVVTCDHMTWVGEMPEGVMSYSSNSVTPDASGLYVFNAPIGRIGISAHAPGYSWVEDNREVRLGLNEFVVELAHSCGVRIKVMDGETSLPWNQNWHFSLLRKDENEPQMGYSWSENRIEVPKAGVYRLELPKFPGFKCPDPGLLTIKEGEMLDVVLRLER